MKMAADGTNSWDERFSFHKRRNDAEFHKMKNLEFKEAPPSDLVRNTKGNFIRLKDQDIEEWHGDVKGKCRAEGDHDISATWSSNRSNCTTTWQDVKKEPGSDVEEEKGDAWVNGGEETPSSDVKIEGTAAAKLYAISSSMHQEDMENLSSPHCERNIGLCSCKFIKEEWIDDIKTECQEEEETWTDTKTAAIHSNTTWQDAAVKKEPCSDIKVEGVMVESSEVNSEFMGDPAECPERQQKENSEEGNYCRKSKKSFNRHKHNRKHISNSKTAVVQPFECDMCDYKGKTMALLKTHIARVHEKQKRHTCSVCGHKFFHKAKLRAHMLTHSGEKPYECGNCNRRFKQKSSSAKHERRCDSHACDICDFTTLRASYLESHMRIHTKRLYTCYDCNYTCSKKENLKAHVSLHMVKQPYSCPHCKRKFTTEKDLKRHSYKHTQKLLTCDECEYKTTCTSSMRTHIRRKHTGEKPFSCDSCNYKCTKMSDLRRHEAVHTGLKRFACDYCEYKCSRHDVLVQHTRTHTGEKPYTCDNCGYKCSQPCNLRNHKPYCPQGKNEKSKSSRIKI